MSANGIEFGMNLTCLTLSSQPNGRGPRPTRPSSRQSAAPSRPKTSQPSGRRSQRNGIELRRNGRRNEILRAHWRGIGQLLHPRLVISVRHWQACRTSLPGYEPAKGTSAARPEKASSSSLSRRFSDQFRCDGAGGGGRTRMASRRGFGRVIIGLLRLATRNKPMPYARRSTDPDSRPQAWFLRRGPRGWNNKARLTVRDTIDGSERRKGQSYPTACTS